ncbi:MAG: MG2 domain-containing protein [Kiritimatiellia bacterium]|nr:MG2 domain-containing protein [Kiritimatiellia bacterium]
MKDKILAGWAMSTILVLFALGAVQQEPKGPSARRDKARKEMANGNFKDAYELFEKLAIDNNTKPDAVGQDLVNAITCLQRINRVKDVDDFRERVVDMHANRWQVLMAVAGTYFRGPYHYGTIVAGKFERGHHRGGGRYVNCFERDRLRSLQLMDQAAKVAARNKEQPSGSFYQQFSSFLMGYRGYQGGWRLQYLSDLSELPDYEDGYRHHRGAQGAPVDQDGNPVFHSVPDSYNNAATDGERWRWMLKMAGQTDPNLKKTVDKQLADFLYNQFGVQTMAHYGRFFSRRDDGKKDESGTYALHTLGEDETIAKLATGIKRFELPDEFNFVRIFRELGETRTLASLFENRRQYDKAAKLWKKGGNSDRVRQITSNWGQFEPVMTHPAGKAATVEYKFRNGNKVSFEAHEIKMRELLNDVKAHLKTNPRKIDHNNINIGNIGYQLVQKKQTKYLGKRVASWSQKLSPRDLHFDKRTTIQTPLKKAGVYLLTAKMAGGNTSKIIIWVNDTVIVHKNLNTGNYYFVADAVTGKPLRELDLEFFGYRQESTKWEKAIGRRYNVFTKDFTKKTDAFGQVTPKQSELENRYSWLITTSGDSERLAFMGFQGVWYGRRHDQEYNRTKVFTITDRPVYRPDQRVKFKFWVRHAKYDRENTSDFANQNLTVDITNPKGERLFTTTIKSDEYGGIDGEYLLPDDAALGVYGISIRNKGGSRFRVEEYKKPEFEVNVDAPDEPVMLGEKIGATVVAKYYFGAPVTEAKVKYKVLRSSHDARWYPIAPWDWFYGKGYWWYAYDYTWYPGWHHWGCLRPRWWWWPTRHEPPEVVAEGEAKVDSDGRFNIQINTAIAKELHGDTDHRYEITAEVTDKSRRTIVGKGTVLVARRPFKVYAWVDRGHYRIGDVIQANFFAQTLDNKPVQGKGALNLFKISYRDGKPVEHSVQNWSIDTDDEGKAHVQLKASESGQYRLSYKVTDTANHTIEGGYVFSIHGAGFDGKQFRFNELELIPEKREYADGEKIQLMINTDRENGTVIYFVRPSNGVYLKPTVLSLEGKSTIQEIGVTKKDMPNFFIEALTVSNGKIYTETREIIVPPEKRVLNVDVLPSAEKYKPGEHAKVKVKLTDFFGKPFVGSAAMSVYDKSVEYISGGSNVPEIKAFFWKWRRRHNVATRSSLDRYFRNMVDPGKQSMHNLGIFGHLVADEEGIVNQVRDVQEMSSRQSGSLRKASARSFSANAVSAPMASMALADSAVASEAGESAEAKGGGAGSAGAEAPPVEPTVRKEFADTAFWDASIRTDGDGIAEIEFDMPENLTGWKIKTWAMGHGTKVGQGESEVVTVKNLLLRLQAPRFFVEKDEVVLSANIHNYLENQKKVSAVLELDGGCIQPIGGARQIVEVKANGEARVDWRVKVVKEGEAVVRMKALTDEESDAMEMRFPVYVHGMMKMESFSGVIRPHAAEGKIELVVPEERRIDESRLEVRYSPTLAGAMVDALPYLVEYPYGCTEQTLSRFLPTVITQKIIKDMGIDLEAVREKITNLNAQEIGDDLKRMKDWQRLCGTKRWDGKKWANRNPVFDEAEVKRMVRKGVKRLTTMQLTDGGWGWFSGRGERSYPHTTAYVVHGLQIARLNGVKIENNIIARGVKWLERYQDEQVQKIKNWEKDKRPRKRHADNLDAFVYMVLNDADVRNGEMNDFLYRDRNELAVYAKAMYGLALHVQKQHDRRDMLIRNIEQLLVKDKENQTAYLNLNNGGYWWYWYGSEYEAHAYYLKLLAATKPKSEQAAGLVKYLLNNRRHATYWKSTRDTAVCIEAMADYLRATGEDKPDMTVQVLVDGRKMKEVRITPDNLFSFDNKFVLFGDAVEEGKHEVTLRRKGKGPVYYNAYLSNFTLEDFITKAGLEIKVDRAVYKLLPEEKTIKVAGARGQALDQKVEKYRRVKLKNLDTLKSGDLVEIELEIASKNDYEYIVFEDMKAAGFEPVEVQSGYNGNDMGAYVEFRDERVGFFVRSLARGNHSVSYRMRAEIPGRFSALPTKAHAMYAPELKANSDEIKLNIED